MITSDIRLYAAVAACINRTDEQVAVFYSTAYAAFINVPSMTQY